MRPRPPPCECQPGPQVAGGHPGGAGQRAPSNLEIAFPGAARLFSDLDSPIALAFLGRFPSVTQAAWLTEARLAAFLGRMGYPGRKAAAELLGRLADAPAGLTGPEGEARAMMTLGWSRPWTHPGPVDELQGEIVNPARHACRCGHLHHLPRAGRVRAAALLAEIGDCRARFPDAESLTCLAGRPIDPAVGQAQQGRVRLCLRQEAAGRGHGLRR